MIEKIRAAVDKPLENENIILDDIEFGEEDGAKTLFIIIDSKEEVDVDLCVKATDIINPIIEELDLIKEDYVLDISGKVKGNES